MDKRELRKLMSAKRSALAEDVRETYDEAILKKLELLVGEYRSVAVFVSVNDEIDTRKFIQYCFDKGIKVSVPKVNGDRMIFVTVTSWYDLVKGNWDIPEPLSDTECHDIDICITPLLAYDASLHRLGYGGGYYDRYFAANEVFRVGIAYSFQFREEDVYDDYDIRMDKVLTE